MRSNDVYKIEIPVGKGIYSKKAGKKSERYVYKRTKYYRNDKGQATSKSVCIGKVCPDDEKMMIPNLEYFSIFNLPAPNELWKENDSSKLIVSKNENTVDLCIGNNDEIYNVWCYGYTYVIFKLSTDLGLFDILSNCLETDTVYDIISEIAYIIEKGNSMDEMEDWAQHEYLPYEPVPFESQRISLLFQSLSYNLRQSILAKWAAANKTEDCICYDVTSVSSYSNNNPEIEYGYNRDHEKLPQLNMGYFSSLSTRRPLTYAVYNGSLNDSTNLSSVLSAASEIGLNNFHLFSDGGFFYEKCFKPLKKCMKSFTVGMPLDRNISKQYVDKTKPDIQDMANRIISKHIQCIDFDGVVYKTKGRILVFFDQGKADDENCSMDEEIAKLSGELDEAKKLPKDKKYKKYFKLTQHENDNGFDYEIDVKKVNELAKYHGYFLIFTNNKDFTPLEVLEHYREKDIDEKMFYQIKNPMRGARNKTHSKDSTEGKLFITFLTTIIRSELHNMLRAYLQKKSFSMKRIVAKLNNIMLSYGPNGYRLVNSLTKDQREILEELGMIDGFMKSIDKLNLNIK